MPALSFKYGELTSNPVSVKKAAVSASSLPTLNKSLVSVLLTTTNTEIQHDIAATLKLQLPPSASVKGFEVKKQNMWYPATAVAKQKAAAVVYKEKEKNREVAVTNVTASNLFEIGVHPLPYNVDVLCRLEIMLSLDETKELIDSIKESAMAFETSANSDAMLLDDSVGGSAIVGESFGKTHFVCRIPPIPSVQGTAKIPKVALFWDTSASAKPTKAQLEGRLLRLKELLVTGDTGHVTLHTFGSSIQHVGDYSKVDELITAIEGLDYDGGTFFDELPDYLGAAGAASNNEPDCILIVTDGVDCLDRIPSVGPGIQIPIHCIADNDVVNMPCLRSLVAVSALSGTILTKKDVSFVEGVLQPRPVLRSIKTDQDEEAFLEEVDDGFRCVPDHRLGVLNRPISSEGILISGILKQDGQQEPCTVSTIEAEVVCGKEIHEFQFCLDGSVSTESKAGSVIKAEILAPTTSESNESCPADASRILGHVYAEEIYAEAENFGLKSGLDMATTRRDLAEKYGFCSPDSSLLMLYETEQFLEHGIVPPLSHPARNSPDFGEMFGSGSKDAVAKGSNGIGDHKTDEQLKTVCALANKLQTYQNTEYKAPSRNQDRGNLRLQSMNLSRQSRSFGFCAGGGAELAQVSRGRVRRMDMCAEPTVRRSMACREMERRAMDPRELRDQARSLQQEMSEEVEEDREDNAMAFMACDGMALDMDEECCEEQDDLFGGAIVHGKSKKRKESAGPSKKGPSIAKPKDKTKYLNTLERALAGKGRKDWWGLYNAEKEAFGDFRTASPSLYLNTARVLSEKGNSLDAFRVATNCLETGINDVQMLRSVGYLVLSIGGSIGPQRAIELFDKIRELSPCEPQSYLDCALSRFYKSSKDKSDPGTIAKDIEAAQSFLVHVLTHQWADRFNEVEWPALILLHYIAAFVRKFNDSNVSALNLVEWPLELKCFNEYTASATNSDTMDSLRCKNFDLALCVWLGWDTDKVDVDLHVKEPSGHEVYYGHREGAGSNLSQDFTQGYGPEVYILKASAVPEATAKGSEFDVYAKYFASHQDSLLTGTTSAVVWTLEKNTGLDFRFVRLGSNKEKTHVATVSVGKNKKKEP